MIRCITIDDEPLALKQIASYIDKTPFLELCGQFDNAIEAIDFIANNAVDLMFVDINMPDLNGMDFVKSLSNAPKVIFTTAYSEYALEGFKVNAVDYLLKPIAYADFLKAASKAKDIYFSNANKSESIGHGDDFLFIKSEYKVLRINYSDIKYIEGMREYVRIYLDKDAPVMALMSMKKIADHLPEEQFMRVHRSYIVNLNKITCIERNRIVFDKTFIPISDQYKEAFQIFLDERFLK
ncbi:LytTR family DNA-binding domain-containing protein [Carboxylicivirga sp. M1479]|uniref:LytR/AlgR family response regulator transcription factor n=1 Tax=Carboxylicivirga sp. M1479 TaxID=2594476 RepID=UPI001177A3FE|nr:LytTR family DNA-binding domain-containing protein [Carboxylicivirga sp. M1479]TRX71105.1 response regulator transcription factor [Carboxylicivirga sp. M1479]